MKYVIRGVTLALGTVLLATPGASAQVGRNADRVEGRPVREQLEAVFMARVQSALGLSEAESLKFAGVLRESAADRRRIEQAERELKVQLQAQLRPGVAANTAVVSELLDKLLANRVEFAESSRSEMRQLREFLTPVQQGQYFLMRDQLLRRAQELIESRQGTPVRGRPVGN
ncbi:MAG TPA: hypothetical protein VFN22_08865 [Gemmatimonadales bacterium]|nr:hypothetical protein [Gemmatimonadales bacterium]